ncbi:hypothetical protein AGDE_09426 [Angomonas deanei]|nr:hypothetical protein AGDE_09426 [Angomonas deanei]|eukprot:EPY30473.1 hypothetical protein AGDE_09426 [Angomonas deanei]
MVLDEFSAFQKIRWQYLIVDEAHKLKNDQSRAHMALDSLHTSHRIIITGTPLQNNLKELWALLHFLAPKLFKDSSVFDAWFDTNAGQQDDNAMENLHKILSPMMLRRLKADVNTGIPPKKEIYVSCKLSKKQREWYLHVLTNDAEALNKASGGSITSLSNVLMQLRKVINHPYLMKGGEEGPPFITDEKLIKTSGKMVILDKLLHRLRADKEGQHKVLIFSQFTTMLDIIEDYCNFRGIKYCRIDGNTSGYQRDSQMAAFNAPNSEYFVFLLSTRAGGLGINLQAANHVILYDSDWNPQMDLQAQDRAHRIGQKRSVRVYRFVTDQTVEERIYRRALKKLYLDAVVVQQGRIQSKATNQVSKEEMLSMIKFGAEEIFKSRHEDITEADIDQLLDAGEAKSSMLTDETKKQIQASLASFELGAEEANLYDFEGVSFRDGEKTRTLHLRLKESISQEDLKKECEKYGDVVKVALHPNLKEALVYYRSLGSAIEAQSKLPFESVFASKDTTAVVTGEMITELIGEQKLGRGHRVREERQMYIPPEVRTESRQPAMRLPAAPRFPSYQLFNAKRLTELHNLEVALKIEKWKKKNAKKPAKESTIEADEKEEDEESEDEAEAELPPVEKAERERLLQEGFANWTSAEYRAVIAALCSGTVDLDDYTTIAAAVGPTKTPQEVKEYILAFFERGEQSVKGYARIEARIKKARDKRQEKENLIRAARWKVESCDTPETQMTFRTKGVTSLDKKLFLTAYRSNFDNENVASLFQTLPENKFDVWCQSRYESYFERRLRVLLFSVKREWELVNGGDGNTRPLTRKRME